MEKTQAAKKVSYSQFSLYNTCPRRWKLDYLDGLRQYEQNINTCFGSAFHHTVQSYVQCMFTDSLKKAEEMDLENLLKESMFNEYKQALAKNGNKHFSTPTELAEFHQDGVAILQYFKKRRVEFFSPKHHKLIGIELPLTASLPNNINFIGFIDIVIQDTRDNTIIIYDIKTSTQGWNKYQKADKSKTAQLILYKEFYAKQFGVDVDNIHVEYIIVRRKINEDLEFAPKRIQTFAPPSGKPTRNKINKLFEDFLNDCFVEGDYNKEGNFPAYKSSACNYCPYKDQEQHCVKKQRTEKIE